MKAIVEGEATVECAEVAEGERGVFLLDGDGEQIGYVPYESLDRVVERRTPVSSTSLRRVGYDEGSRTLEVEFHDGGVYEYDDVPEETFRDLLQADSRGRYFQENVKGAYEFRQLL